MKLRLAVKIVLLIAAVTGCTHIRDSCQKLAWPQPPVAGATLESCVQRVLADQLTGGKEFDLWTRARTRDLIVDRQLTQFAPQLRQIASLNARGGDPIQERAIADALHALTLLRDPAAAELNVRHIHDNATPTLLAAVIGNLTFLKDFSATEKIERLTDTTPVDYLNAYLLTPVFEHLAAANYHSPTICRRRDEIGRALAELCPAPCRSIYALTKERLDTYARAHCATND